MSSKGALKYDGGKPRMDLLDAYAIEELAKVLTFGAQKYAPWNWAKGMEFSRLQAAALRHLFSFQAGEDLDPESGLPHLAHAMCCLMFLLSMTVRHPEMDDRVPSPEPDRQQDDARLVRFKCALCERPMICSRFMKDRPAVCTKCSRKLLAEHLGTKSMKASSDEPAAPLSILGLPISPDEHFDDLGEPTALALTPKSVSFGSILCSSRELELEKLLK